MREGNSRGLATLRPRNPQGSIDGNKWEARDWVKGRYPLQCGHRILPICVQHRAPHTNQHWVRGRTSGTVTGKLGKETAVHSQRGICHLLSQVGTQGQSHTGFQKNRVQFLSSKSVVRARWWPSAPPRSHGRHYRRTGKRRDPLSLHSMKLQSWLSARPIWASDPFARLSCHVTSD